MQAQSQLTSMLDFFFIFLASDKVRINSPEKWSWNLLVFFHWFSFRDNVLPIGKITTNFYIALRYRQLLIIQPNYFNWLYQLSFSSNNLLTLIIFIPPKTGLRYDMDKYTWTGLLSGEKLTHNCLKNSSNRMLFRRKRKLFLRQLYINHDW